MSAVVGVNVIEETLPLGLDLGAQYPRIETLGYVLIGLVDEAGRTGVGWTFSIDPGEARRIAAATRARAGLLVGLDPAETDANWDRLRAACAGLERGVASPFASACDIALWDLYGCQSDEPIHRLLGARTASLSTYASDALWSSLGPEVLARNAASFVGEGFDAIKLRTGGARDPAREVERIEAVRAAVGGETVVLYDALQTYDVGTAIAVGRALERCGIGWLEDPVSEQDLEGLARVREALEVPVVSGEDACWPDEHESLLARPSVDVLMVDPKWVGGITPWLRVARRAAARGIRMVSHVSPELSAPVLAAESPDERLEWFSWSFGLYEPGSVPRVEAGRYALPDAAGFGLGYRRDLLERLFG